MKFFIGIIYLAAAISGLFWTLRMYLLGIYGANFSWWYPVMLVASLSLLSGAFLTWFSTRDWTQWLPVFGSIILTVCIVPAITETLRAYFKGEVVGGSQLYGRIFSTVLVLASLMVSIANKLQGRAAQF